ncbi:SlyX family protein [Salinicola aestuarinus]|uniref:SlyX family protein n=1 Tax=Salinicola aestuarinus TaxID=1949082 RepID=UPI000DA16521|nr:SlyX family protein [Salinicola aestuarinus]
MTYDTQREKSNTAIGEQRTPLEERVEALESRLTFQEDWLETLDRRLREQDAEIERLTRLNALMRERLREQGQVLADLGGEQSTSHDDLPPHY